MCPDHLPPAVPQLRPGARRELEPGLEARQLDAGRRHRGRTRRLLQHRRLHRGTARKQLKPINSLVLRISAGNIYFEL